MAAGEEDVGMSPRCGRRAHLSVLVSWSTLRPPHMFSASFCHLSWAEPALHAAEMGSGWSSPGAALQCLDNTGFPKLQSLYSITIFSFIPGGSVVKVSLPMQRDAGDLGSSPVRKIAWRGE